MKEWYGISSEEAAELCEQITEADEIVMFQEAIAAVDNRVSMKHESIDSAIAAVAKESGFSEKYLREYYEELDN